MPGGPDPFEAVSWFFGPSSISPQAMLLPVVIIVGLTLAASAIIGLMAWWAVRRTPGTAETTS
jgi:hypothetical protein